jgi:hypothetical protein
VQQELSAGAIDDHTAQDVQHGVDDAVHKYNDQGDLDQALESISQTQDKLTQAVDHKQATSAAAAAINAKLDAVAEAMRAAPPSGGEDKGKDKGKHH